MIDVSLSSRCHIIIRGSINGELAVHRLTESLASASETVAHVVYCTGG